MRVALLGQELRRRDNPPGSDDATGSAPRRRAPSVREDRSSGWYQSSSQLLPKRLDEIDRQGRRRLGGKQVGEPLLQFVRCETACRAREASSSPSCSPSCCTRASAGRLLLPISMILPRNSAAARSLSTFSDAVVVIRHHDHRRGPARRRSATGEFRSASRPALGNEAEILERLGQEDPDVRLRIEDADARRDTAAAEAAAPPCLCRHLVHVAPQRPQRAKLRLSGDARAVRNECNQSTQFTAIPHVLCCAADDSNTFK